MIFAPGQQPGATQKSRQNALVCSRNPGLTRGATQIEPLRGSLLQNTFIGLHCCRELVYVTSQKNPAKTHWCALEASGGSPRQLRLNPSLLRSEVNLSGFLFYFGRSNAVDRQKCHSYGQIVAMQHPAAQLLPNKLP